MRTKEEVAEIRSAIQEQAYTAWKNADRKGTIVAGTGVGKSRLVAIRVSEIVDEWSTQLEYPNVPPILLVVPTEKLRDENWPAEFKKWGIDTGVMDRFVKRICYASLPKEVRNRYQLVALDEAHRVTIRNAEAFQGDVFGRFFADNVADEVMALTATVPDPLRDFTKADILNQIAPVCFTYTREQGITDGIIPAAEIKVIHIPLDKVTKYIPAGGKKTPFLQTENGAYDYLCKNLKKAFAAKRKNPGSKWAEALTGQRFQLIAGLRSKTRIGKAIMDRICPGNRVLIFCGNIAQSVELCGMQVFNSSAEAKKADMLTKFKNGEIDYLGVVNAVNKPFVHIKSI